MQQQPTHTFTDFVHRYQPSTEEMRDAPTLLLLHGTGGNEHDLLGLGHMLLSGAAMLSPRGKVLEHGMPRFFRRLAEGVFDVEDLKVRTHELAEFVVSASHAYQFDPTNVIAVGFSNGANIAANVLLERPGVLAGAILFHPMVPSVPDPLPALTGTPVFISAGRADPIVPQRETERLEQLLKRSGAEVTTRWHNGGHSITHEDVREAKAWLAELLANKK